MSSTKTTPKRSKPSKTMLYFGIVLNILIASIWLAGPSGVRPIALLHIFIAVIFIAAARNLKD